MANKIKIPNERLKRFKREEEKRKKDVRNKRKYFLIVCEGEETEPNYFEGLKNDLPKGVLTNCWIKIEGTGHNTESLVDEALRLKKDYERKHDRKIDKLWVVLDRDSFDAQNFNNAILRCEGSKPVIGCAWSNEAFELWYLLHFGYYQNAMSRSEYKGLIERHLKPVLGQGYRYEKNSRDMYRILKTNGSQQVAIRNARKLSESHGKLKNYANQNPRTLVYKIIEELNNLTAIN